MGIGFGLGLGLGLGLGPGLGLSTGLGLGLGHIRQFKKKFGYGEKMIRSGKQKYFKVYSSSGRNSHVYSNECIWDWFSDWSESRGWPKSTSSKKNFGYVLKTQKQYPCQPPLTQ